MEAWSDACEALGREHATAMVRIASPEGVMLALNTHAREIDERDRAPSGPGLRLSDVMSDLAAQELLALGVGAIDSGEEAIAVGYIAGRRCCVRLKPVRSDGRSAFAIVVDALPSRDAALALLPERAVELGVVARDRLCDLSDHEIRILRYVAQEMSNEDIRRLMHRSLSAVEWHTRNVLRKLGERTRIGVFRVGVASGLADFSDRHWEALLSTRRDANRREHAMGLRCAPFALRPRPSIPPPGE